MGIQPTHTVNPVAETTSGSPFRRNAESKDKPAKAPARDLDPDEAKSERKGRRRKRGLDIRA